MFRCPRLNNAQETSLLIKTGMSRFNGKVIAEYLFGKCQIPYRQNIIFRTVMF